MKESLQAAFDFAEQIKHVKGIRQVILFGSVARGEDTPSSDIDIAIIHERGDAISLMDEINKSKPDRIQTTFVASRELPRETELVGALSGEGLLLAGRPVVLQQKNIGLKAKLLVAYSLAHLPQAEKMKVKRALFGSVSRSTLNGKHYQTVTKGAIGEAGVEKLGRGVLLVAREKAPKVLGILRRFNARVKEIPVWGY